MSERILAKMVRGRWPLRSSHSLLAATLALLSGGFQLVVAFRVDLLLTPRQHGGDGGQG